MKKQPQRDELEATLQTVKFFEEVLRASADGIVITDVSQTIIKVNETFCAIFNQSRNNVIETSLFTWLSQFDGDAEKRWTDMEKRLRQEIRCRNIEFILNTNGRKTYLNVNASLLGQTSEKESGVIITLWRDITERKQAEEALQKEMGLNLTLLDNMPCTALILKKGTREIVAANKIAREQGIVPGKTCFKTSAKRNNPCPFCLAPEVWATDEAKQIEVEYMGVYYEGIWVPLSEDLYVHYIFDITERKRAEDALQTSEKKFRVLATSSTVGIFQTDVNGNCIYVNDRWSEIAGMSQEKALGEGWVRGIHPEDRKRVFKHWYEAANAGKEFIMQYRFKTPQEKVTWVTGRAASLTNDLEEKIGYIGTISDITELKQAEEELIKHREQLEETVEERTKKLEDAQEKLVRKEKLAILGQLSGSVGHELRNPLAAINNAAYYLKMVLPDSDEKIKDHIEIISSGVNNAKKIISGLLDFSRTKPICKEETSINELIRMVLKKHPPPKEVKVTIEINNALPNVYIDPHQIEMVLTNLVTNACQAMPDGGNLTINAEDGNAKVRIKVNDTGCGISSENQKKIFEPLFTTKAKGVGLGLSVTKNLVEANDGSIEVESNKDKGTSFTITLPIKK